MSENKYQLYKSLGFLSSVGISMVASTLIGLGMGWWLDKKFDTNPWFTLIFLGFGIVSAFRNVYILTARELRRQKQEDQDQSGESG
ncbi:MAG: AtpZ/AtpI family protein [Desulfuromonadaceae bacterium]|jgi:ATP synthase protein I